MRDAVETITLILTIFRVFCWFVLLIVTTLYIGIITRRKVVHPNLHVLLLSMPLSYLIYIIPSACNLIIDSFQIQLPSLLPLILHALADFGLFGSSFNLFSFTFERLIATWRVDDYENISSRVSY
ncbi:hypothetical protein PENTCL1PPCAC_551, partial [Pristionchus entomophagus]